MHWLSAIVIRDAAGFLARLIGEGVDEWVWAVAWVTRGRY